MSTQLTLKALLDKIPATGSAYGGGSMTAASLAMACALIEKVTPNPQVQQETARFRALALQSTTQDATVFKRVLLAMRKGKRAEFKKNLRAATDLQLEIYQLAHLLLAGTKQAHREVKSDYLCDLKCARALLKASKEGAKALILANIDWLDDAAYTKKIQKEL